MSDSYWVRYACIKLVSPKVYKLPDAFKLIESFLFELVSTFLLPLDTEVDTSNKKLGARQFSWGAATRLPRKPTSCRLRNRERKEKARKAREKRNE